MMMFLLGLFTGAAVGWLGIALLSANRETPVPLDCSCAPENGGRMTSRDMNEGSMCG